jgi:hypothetical protein
LILLPLIPADVLYVRSVRGTVLIVDEQVDDAELHGPASLPLFSLGVFVDREGGAWHPLSFLPWCGWT